MKTNAPEKIYMSPAGVLYKGDKQQSNDIEYTRADAFIEKACAYLKDRIEHDSIDYPMARMSLINDFKKYMEGE